MIVSCVAGSVQTSFYIEQASFLCRHRSMQASSVLSRPRLIDIIVNRLEDSRVFRLRPVYLLFPNYSSLRVGIETVD